MKPSLGMGFGAGGAVRPPEPWHPGCRQGALLQLGLLEGMVALPNYTAIPRDMHQKSRPRFKHPREALAEGAGGRFGWDVPGHVPWPSM